MFSSWNCFTDSWDTLHAPRYSVEVHGTGERHSNRSLPWEHIVWSPDKSKSTQFWIASNVTFYSAELVLWNIFLGRFREIENAIEHLSTLVECVFTELKIHKKGSRFTDQWPTACFPWMPSLLSTWLFCCCGLEDFWLGQLKVLHSLRLWRCWWVSHSAGLSTAENGHSIVVSCKPSSENGVTKLPHFSCTGQQFCERWVFAIKLFSQLLVVLAMHPFGRHGNLW